MSLWILNAQRAIVVIKYIKHVQMFSTCFNNFFPFVFALFGLSIVEISTSKVAGQERARASVACQHISNQQLYATSLSTYTCLVEHRRLLDFVFWKNNTHYPHS